MSKLTEAAGEVPPRGRKGPVCGMVRIRAGFDPDDQAFFDKLLDEVRMGKRTAASVSRILGRTGIAYTGTALARHMRGECSCTGETS